MLITPPVALRAQGPRPAGVVAPRRAESSKGVRFFAGVSPATLVDSAHGRPWRWVGTGALVGGATSGVVAAVSVSRTDDAFFAAPAIAIATAAGAVIGGLVGGLFYLISH